MPGIHQLPLLRPETGRSGRAVIYLGSAIVNAPELPRPELPSVHLKADAIARAALIQRFPEPDDLAELHVSLTEAPARLDIRVRLLDRAGHSLQLWRAVLQPRLTIEREHIDEFVAGVARHEGLVLIVSHLEVPGIGPEAHPRTLYLSPSQVSVTTHQSTTNGS